MFKFSIKVTLEPKVLTPLWNMGLRIFSSFLKESFRVFYPKWKSLDSSVLSTSCTSTKSGALPCLDFIVSSLSVIAWMLKLLRLPQFVLRINILNFIKFWSKILKLTILNIKSTYTNNHWSEETNFLINLKRLMIWVMLLKFESKFYWVLRLSDSGLLSLIDF